MKTDNKNLCDSTSLLRFGQFNAIIEASMI